jgi:pantoate kinase
MQEEETNQSTGPWGCGVVLKRTTSSTTPVTWTVSVAADGKDHRVELDEAVKQALEVWDHFKREFDRR